MSGRVNWRRVRPTKGDRIDVLIARSSAIAPEPRVERAASCLAEKGLRVIVVGWDREMQFAEREQRPNRVTLLRVRARGGYGLGAQEHSGIGGVQPELTEIGLAV